MKVYFTAVILLASLTTFGAREVAAGKSKGPFFEGYCSKYLSGKLKGQLDAKRETGDLWRIDGARNPEASPYEHGFGQFLGSSQSLSTHFAKRKKNGKSNHILDLFGSGIVTTDFSNIDSITGVRLLKVPIKTQIPPLPQAHDVLEGDLFADWTWNELGTNLKKREIEHVDVILIRPMGAFVKLENELAGLYEKTDPSRKGSKKHLFEFYKIYMRVIGRAYDLLSIDGEMFVQLPYYGYDGSGNYKEWISRLRKNAIAVQFDASGRLIHLVKTLRSPSVLPF